MLRTRDDVVRHAEVVLRKARNEVERKSRCFFIAQLFSKIKEYDQVINYGRQYLSVKPNSSTAHLLLAQAYEGLGQLDNALTAYENSSKLEFRSEVLLKICELYCDEKVAFDREKAKYALDLAQQGFPHHSVILSLKERLMNSGTNTDKEEYEMFLTNEVKAKPTDSNIRIKLIKHLLVSDRIDRAYHSCCDIESLQLFQNNLDWYECYEDVCDKYYKKCIDKCDYIFYTNWLHCLDRVCSLCCSVDSKKPLNSCYVPVNKLDRILYDCSGKENDEFKQTIDHYAAQLSFHIAMLLTLKAKEDSDYSSKVQINQIWFERKIKIGALLLLSIKNDYLKYNTIYSYMEDRQLKLYKQRINQSKTRYVEVYYTLESFQKNNHQGEKQFIDCINFYVAEKWRNDVYKIFSHLSTANSSSSFFLNSNFFQDVPQKFPSLIDIEDLFTSFEITYCGNLHNMLWLGLQTISYKPLSKDPYFIETFSAKIDRHLRLNSFKSLNLTTYDLSSYSVESLNQLDMDSFLYLAIFSKDLLAKQKDIKIPVVLPSCVSSYLINEKDENFWNTALLISQNNDKDSASVKSELSECSCFDVQVVLEQLRAHKLQLPLIVHLARTFTNRSEIENGVVQDACEKRAAYLWEIVFVNLKNINNKMMPSPNYRNAYFSYEVPNYSQTQIKMLKDEARMFFGSYYKKCKQYNKALDMLKFVQTPDSLYKQATIYETMASQGNMFSTVGSESRTKVIDIINKARDCLIQALNSMKSSGDCAPSLNNSISEKLSNIELLLNRLKNENNGEENNGLNYNSDGTPSYNGSDMEETIAPSGQSYSRSGVRSSKPLSSTPLKNHNAAYNLPSMGRCQPDNQHGAAMNGSGFADICELITLYHNADQLKMQNLIGYCKLITDRLESYENRLDRLESSIKANFTELKKELKQKPDLYNMLEDDEYNPEEVLNYPAYFQRNANLMQGSSTVQYPPAAAPIPPAAYFPPNQLYQGNVPFYAPTVPFNEPQMADYLRTIAANAAAATQRNNALNVLPGANLSGLHQATLVAPPTLPHLQVPSSSPPCPTTKQNQPAAPNNVVITTSDALPTTVSTTAPTLFVNIPPEHRLGTNSAAAAVAIPSTTAASPVPHKFQIPMPSNFKLVDKAPVADPADDKEIEVTLDISKDSDGGVHHVEHDPLPNFKPIIPLPDEVEVKTGEENETVIFDCRAKLYRFVEKEWKERGLGQLKILKSKDDKPQFRILMRREQVHKICANHFITSDMQLVNESEKSYLWWGYDFADEKVELEKFAVKFKTVEDALLFRDKFNDAKKILGESVVSVKGNAMESVQPISKINVPAPKIGVSARTTFSETPVVSDASKENKFTVGGFTFSSTPKLSGTTDIPTDKVNEEKKTVSPFAAFNFGSAKSENNTAQPLFSFSKKPPTTEVKTDQVKKDDVTSDGQSKLLELLRQDTGNNWECNTCYTSNPAGNSICAACEAQSPALAKASEKTQKSVTAVADPKKKDSALPSLSSLFKPAQGSWSCEICLVSNSATVTSCVACGTVKPGCVAETKPAPQTTSFTFGIPPSAATPAFTSAPKPTDSSLGLNDSSQSAFDSNNTSGIFTFGMPTVQPSTNFTFGSAKFNFTMSTPTKGTDEAKSPHTTPGSGQKVEGEDSDNEHDEDQDHTEGIYFQPVVEMPDKIDVKTGEENETVLYSQRSKLFRYDNKEWKERGVGDLKILRHNTTGKIRLLMRREPVMKLSLNHYLTKDLELIAKDKDPKSWIWCAPDFSQGEQILEQFCIRFKTPDLALEFKENFERIKNNADTAVPVKTDDEDVIFVSQTKIVSDELREKAMALKLPENFYRYLDMPDCPGCRGCEKDLDDQVIKLTMPEAVDKTLNLAENQTSRPMFFGSKSLLSTPSIGTPLSVSTSTPPPGGILSGKSIFGSGAIKPATFTNSQDTTGANVAVPVSSTAAPEATKSQISSFSFALPQNNSMATTPFSPQNSVFSSSPGLFGQNSSNIFGSQSTPMFGSKPSGGNQLPATQVNQPIFGSATSFAKSNQIQSATPIFGSMPSVITSPVAAIFPVTTQNETKQEEPSFLNKDAGFSFSSIASEGAKSSFAGDNSSFIWEGAGTMVFGTGKPAETQIGAVGKERDDIKQDDQTKEENTENEEHDPYFEPIMPLPDIIELRTGEEDEDVLFSERGKLFRMDESKSWKERGIGQMKILFHPQFKTYRLLMRREQVHKIVCNHLITPDLSLSPLHLTESSYCWYAMNMSQDETEPSKELLCIKFKNKDLALQFLNTFENAQKAFRSRSPTENVNE